MTFKVLMWKHFIVRKRHWIQMILEYFVPLSLLIGLFVLKDLMHRKTGGKLLIRTNTYENSTFSLSSIDAPAYISYAPDTNFTRRLMGIVQSTLNNSIVNFKNGSVGCSFDKTTFPLLNLMKTARINLKEICAIVEFQDTRDTPDKLVYTIKMNSLIPRRPIAKYQRLFEKLENEPEAFLRLQWAIDSSFLQTRMNKTLRQSANPISNVTFIPLTELRTTRVLNKIFVATVFYLLPYIFFTAPLLPFIFLMNRLMEERATGIQELIKILGVTPTMLGITHFLNSLPASVLFSVFGTWLVKATDVPLVPATNWFVIFLAMFLHFVSTTAMAFMCCYMTRTGQYTVSLSMFVYVGLWIPVRLVGHENTSDVVLFFLGLLPHCPSYWFFRECLVAETRYEVGINLNNWNKRFALYPDMAKNGSVLMSFVMQIIQITFCFVLSCYLDKVRPGRYGIALPWNFLFLKRYRSRSVSVPQDSTDTTVPYDPAYQRYFEESPKHLPVGIQISHVTKVFGTGKKEFKALSNLTLDIYKNEITVLLGHNGAGKTTLISIITGLISPTSGQVYVNGLNTLTQQKEVRKQLGFCPQHNLLFPNLTVLEHLIFFTVIRGSTFSEAKTSADALLERLNLTDQKGYMISKLSGGSLRKLQLGAALCGNSSVLILDEPTSGLDIEARRELWHILLGLRGDRTLILTTHFMEEADVLGDRMAALHGGKLRCHATPIYLKRAVGSGFRISITTRNAPQEEAIANCIKQIVPNAALKEKSFKTLVYNLNAGTNLSQLFKNIENKKADLEIENMGLGATTLEEVFMELCCDVDTQEKPTNEGLTANRKIVNYLSDWSVLKSNTFCVHRVRRQRRRRPPRVTSSPMKVFRYNGPISWSQNEQYRYITGCRQVLRQINELFRRQIEHTYSKLIPYIILQMILPILLCATLTKIFNNDDYEKIFNMTLNLKMYDDYSKRTVRYSVMPELRTDPKSVLESTYPNLTFINFNNTGVRKPIPQDDYLIGTDVKNDSANIFYHPNVEHSASAGLNFLSNLEAITKMAASEGDTIKTIITNNSAGSKAFIPKTKIVCALFAIYNMCTILATAINDVSLPCKERLSVARHTHIMAGCSPLLYWLITFIYHMAGYILFCCSAVVLAANFFDYDDTINDSASLRALFTVVLLSGMNFYSLSYFISFYFSETGASILLIGLIILFGFLSQILLMALEDLHDGDGEVFYVKIMSVIGVVIPPHLYTEAMIRLTETSRLNAYCKYNFHKCPSLGYFSKYFDKTFCCSKGSAEKGPYDHFAFKNPGCGYILLLIFIQFIIFTVLIFLLEYGVFNRWWTAIGVMRKLQYPALKYNCPQLQAEKEYVQQTLSKPNPEPSDVVLMKNVWKIYHGQVKQTFALRDVNFSVKKGECLGILGVNGAGKTTTFKIISRQEAASIGKIFVNGLFSNNRKYLHSLGYCPQFGGLDDFRTGARNLKMLLKLRGLTHNDVQKETDIWLDVIGMKKYGHRVIAGYSGGMVRRLATAASLCGCGSVTLLDEPTAGVDTAARRLIWAAIVKGLACDRAIILSSHSMDEIEKLCNRVMILCDGEMAVLGSPTSLKEEYASGQSIVFKLNVNVVQNNKERVDQLKSRLEQTFDCTSGDEHMTSLNYRINEPLLYSNIFTKVEAISREFKDLVEDYLVSDATLEDVFLKVTNENKQTK